MFTLDQVVPWGRSFEEYQRMFMLTDEDLGRRVLGCGDGPAAFNAEATRRGFSVTSVDPVYRWTTGELRQRVEATYVEMVEQLRQNMDEFVWTSFRSVDELGAVRMAAMEIFLADYDEGKRAGRYIDAALPLLPFADASFDLVLSSHFLFLYSTQLGAAFHAEGIRELCRVAAEVRVFPLLALGGQRSPFVEPAVEELRSRGYVVTIDAVPYEFQRGANQMLRIRRSAA